MSVQQSGSPICDYGSDRGAGARPGGWRLPRNSRRTVVGVGILVLALVFFLTQTRLEATLGKLKVADRATTAGHRSALSQIVDPMDYPAPVRWIAYGINLWDANAIGMFFAVLSAPPRSAPSRHGPAFAAAAPPVADPTGASPRTSPRAADSRSQPWWQPVATQSGTRPTTTPAV